MLSTLTWLLLYVHHVDELFSLEVKPYRSVITIHRVLEPYPLALWFLRKSSLRCLYSLSKSQCPQRGRAIVLPLNVLTLFCSHQPSTVISLYAKCRFKLICAFVYYHYFKYHISIMQLFYFTTSVNTAGWLYRFNVLHQRLCRLQIFTRGSPSYLWFDHG